MADYKDAYDSRSWERTHKLADESAESSRRIQSSIMFPSNPPQYPPTPNTGGYIFPGTPATQTPKVDHTAIFESAGDEFTLAEIRAVVAKFNTLPATATLTFKRYSDIVEEDIPAKNGVFCVVEWEA